MADIIGENLSPDPWCLNLLEGLAAQQSEITSFVRRERDHVHAANEVCRKFVEKKIFSRVQDKVVGKWLRQKECCKFRFLFTAATN